jgi:hypothetical protein
VLFNFSAFKLRKQKRAPEGARFLNGWWEIRDLNP